MKGFWNWLKIPRQQPSSGLDEPASLTPPLAAVQCQLGAVPSPFPDNEAVRLAALRQYHILDTAPEAAFDDLARLATQICEVPIALVSLIDDCRQWFKARVGLAAPQTHRDLAFCAHAIHQPQEVFMVPDTLADPRFATNPLVTADPYIRFYAGAPLVTPAGHVLGTLCVIDRVPRQLRPEQINALRSLSRQVVAQLELRRHVTELTHVNTELQNLSTALESAVEGIAQMDTAGRYTRVNQAYTTLFGYAPQELLGQGWLGFVPPEDRQPLQMAYQSMLSHGKAEVETQGRRRDGSTFDQQVVMVKATDSQQQLIGHYCFVKDITERREIERLKDEFISVVSHELRTPLTSIRGALGLLGSGVLYTQPEKAGRMLEIAINNTDRLVRLINDILDIERIESGKVTMTQQVCEAATLMNQAADLMQGMAAEAGVHLAVSPLTAHLWADPDRILQTLTNLINNAIKFSAPGTTVELTATDQGDQIQFQVNDQGRGIPADKLEAIFDRFQQVDASDARKKGGTGLGLAICRSIVQHHGGRIWAESTLGEGSTFSFTLPVLRRTEDVTPATSEAPLVLVCDDDPAVRTVVQAMLEAQGYRRASRPPVTPPDSSP